MRIVVLGAGVIGVTTAWELAQAGHEVTVIDRQPGPALETSFANAGEVSPGYSTPWAAPGIPMKAVKWMFQKDAPLILNLRPDRLKLTWLGEMLGNCTSAAYAVNKSRMTRLAEYSRDRLDALRATTGITFDDRQKGTLQVFRSDKQIEAVQKDIKVLKEDGVAFEELDRAGCLAAEPGMAGAAHLIAGGLRLPNDQTGDCFKFSNRLAEMAAAAGVAFRWGVGIRRLVARAGRIEAVETDRGLVHADAFVLALGSHSPALTAALGFRLPIYPVKGYSLTAPILDAARAPESTVMDETFKVAITRLGDRIRIGGLAEINGFDQSLNDKRRGTLERSAGSLFVGGGDLKAASFWTGLRPMTPDGTPVVGRSPVENLWLNTGHGTLGWTMSAGSARVIADLISGRATDIDASDLGYARYVKTAVKLAKARGSLQPA
ncbi:D-amino acid dehydrogenase [Frigidibacter sp. MR17.14]|uniref:D-amino acid dehydrogenase n=1 Tax=Frigidibacter sp. MR17.14 TaxID=3126509 RepID=UPI003012C8FA